MNNYVCNGNLTRDPETHTFASGTKIVKFGLAVNGRAKKENGEIVKDANGRVVREVVFWDCKVWGEAGNAIEQYSKKGDKLSISGEIEDETWDDKTSGEKRTKKVVRVEKYEFLGGNKSEISDEPRSTPTIPAGKSKGRPKKGPDSNAGDLVVNDVSEIPF